MELLRALGRGEAFELIGTAPAWLADAELARLYGYTEEEFQAMIDRLPKVYGRNGQDMVSILDNYVEGINEYIADAARGEVPLAPGFNQLGIKAPAPWKPTDVVAVVSIVRALFGAGGGAEMNDAAVLAGLTTDFGAKDARAIYEDFRSRDNADGPVHTVNRFPYIPRDEKKLDPRANPIGSAAQMTALAERSRIKTEHLKLSTPLGAVDLSRPAGSMSNHIVVGASRSASGHPVLIGGPQAGYFSPQILMDYELHSPTIHARGAGFPGLSTLVVLGRTQDYAWTPTAGGSDMIDTYVEKLCDPGGGTVQENSRFYEFKGRCEPMDRRTLRQASTAPPSLGNQLPDIVVERTVHGPVVARVTLGDLKVAISRKRSTYLKELDPAISILRMNRNEATTPDKFVDIFHESHNLSTNWSYANDTDIGYVHGGLYPRRPETIDPDLPVWGTGEWEWKQGADGQDEYLGREEVPYEVKPKRDFFVSWNNRPAPGWGGSDAQWGWSSVYRASLLQDAVTDQKEKIGPVQITQMMEKAGLTDLRGRKVAPLALRLLAQANPGERERKMIALLRTWVADGSLRRDGDKDGQYDHSAAVAIMDAWWEKLIRAVYDPVVGDVARFPLPFDNAPGSGGSAYQDGYYGYLWTDLSMALGDKLKSPTSRLYCGGEKTQNGSAAKCRDRVLASLTQAGDQLAADQDTQDPAAWKSDAQAERILFLPGAALSMHWVNRPTTQQLAMFGARSKNGTRTPCLRASAFTAVGVKPARSGLAFTLRSRGVPARVDILRATRRVKRFSNRRRSFRWPARLRDGAYVVRISATAADGSTDVRRFPLRRSRGRFHRLPAFERRRACGAITFASLGQPTFRAKRLRVAFRLTAPARVTVTVRRGHTVVRRIRAARYDAGRTHRRILSARGLRHGRYTVTLRAVSGRTATTAVLSATR
jgi:acyl-homoserine lactone acylase PvdQ